MFAVGGWAIMEVVRYRFPVGGQEWGAAGYALSDNLYLRMPAEGVGTSGLTVIVVALAALIALAMDRSWDRRLRWAALFPAVAIVASVPSMVTVQDAGPFPVAIVQGSTPCPFEHCPPDERLRTFEQHLALTQTIEPGSVDLIVWPESSTGSTNADPILNDEVRETIAAEARRIGAAILVGGDRIVGDDEFINANVLFDSEGEIVGEYRKQHPVPFGEYIPARPLFEWIPALDRVPRDMIPGDGPVVFDLGAIELGSVISWEGGFSRYALQHRRAGANVIAVTTNKASYGPDAAYFRAVHRDDQDAGRGVGCAGDPRSRYRKVDDHRLSGRFRHHNGDRGDGGVLWRHRFFDLDPLHRDRRSDDVLDRLGCNRPLGAEPAAGRFSGDAIAFEFDEIELWGVRSPSSSMRSNSAGTSKEED